MDQKSTSPDVWGLAVASGDAVKLSQMVVEWSASEPKVALWFLRKCVALVEEDLAYCAGPRPPSSTSARPDGFVQNKCLDAFGVVLNQSCGGSDWFASTKELQLASLQFCGACRNVATLTLRVDDAVPRSLLAAADAPAPGRKRLCTTSVPRLRARRVLWDLPTAVELRRAMYALADATYLRFGCDFGDTLEGVEWPRRLRAIKIECNEVCMRLITRGVLWPPSLLQISFGNSFNQSIKDVVWPTSLQQLTFGEEFDRPIEGVVWPTSLQRLDFGCFFGRPLVGVVWPTSLQQLNFRGSFDEPIREVLWPTSLQHLTFGDGFDRPIEGVKWPTSLQQLTFGDSFNQPIGQVVWPNSLRRLSFGETFNQPIEGVKWSTSLEELVFGTTYCATSAAEIVSIESNFNQAIGGAQWPGSLWRLTLGGDFSCSCSELGVWMPNLEELTLLPEDPSSYGRLLRGVEWPESLRKLTMFDDAGLNEVVIPRKVQVVRHARLT